MAIEQQSAAVGAVGEKGVGVLSRSQTTRLPDRAATAALYMTHPDRRLSVREPAIADAQLLRDSTATANWRLDLSHASASAALAHTRSKPIEVWRPKAQPAAERAAFHARDFPAPDAIYVAKPTPESHLAAASAIRDRRSIISTPPAPLEMEPEQLADLQRRASQREKALLAATGAYSPRRKRAGTAPSKPSASVSQRPLAASAAGASREAAAAEPLEPTIVDDFPPSVEASRIQHVTNTDPQLYTSHPPVEGEEEQRKKNVQQAAVVSMARDMYDITEAKGEAEGKPSPAVSAAQRGQTRMQPRKAPNQRDPAAVKQAIGLQEAAQKRAQEKLALMHNEAAAFQEYYGTAPQPARGLGSRKRRTSSDTDVEQSKEIRKQMSSLRFKLNTVDEKRERDRHLLMEAARRNVDAAIHDMEKKVYHDTGRAPSSLQREWEQEAEQRMKKEQQQQQQQPDKVNIGAEQFVNMSDVEATARSRVKPTLDEINENADEYQDKLEADRAREMEERLDQERQKGLQSTQRQRESDLKAEEKRLKDYLKHENKEGKTEKSRLFGKRSKRSSKGAEPATEKAEATGAAGGTTTGAAKETEAAGAAKETEAAGAAKEGETTGAAKETEAAGAAKEGETTGAAKETEAAGAAKDAETTGAAKDTEIAGAAGGAGATGATGAGATGAPAPVAAVEAPADEGPSSGEEIPEMYPSQGVEGENELVTAPPQEQKVTPKSESKLRNWFRKSRGSRRSSVPDEPQPKEERAPREPDRRASAAEDAAVRVREDSRGAALASHPITGEELDEMQRRRSVASTTEENAGQSVAKDSSGDQRRSSFFRRSNLKKMVSRNGHEPKTNGAPEQTEGTAAAAATGDAPASPSILHRASIPEREDLRDYAAEQGLPVPPAGIGKQTSHGTRESRFSEDL